jgi:hypothetical protein
LEVSLHLSLSLTNVFIFSHSLFHSLLLFFSSSCFFYRGSSNNENWINNAEGAILLDDIPTSDPGRTRKVHRGFLQETIMGVNAVNSYTGFDEARTKDKQMYEVWNDINAITGCTERIYTGHSLGGGCSVVGHYLFEKSHDTSADPIFDVHSAYTGGNGRGVSWAGPAPWVHEADNTLPDGISEEPMCINKRWFLDTSRGGKFY